MLDEKVIEVVPPTQNGNAPPQRPSLTSARETPADREVKPTSAGRALEMLTAASLAGCFFVIGLNSESWFPRLGLVLLLVAISFVAYNTAIRQATGAAKHEEDRRANRKYRVTVTRLQILEDVGVPDEVIRELSLLLGQPPLPEDHFFDKIATSTDLGRNRTNQFRETILKYTEVDMSHASKPAVNNPAVPPTVRK